MLAILHKKNNAKTVDMHEYNETVRDLCKQMATNADYGVNA